MSIQPKKIHCAVILTAIRIEYLAVRAQLENLRQETHPQGTIYERGTFSWKENVWEVIIGEIGMGGPNAALESERVLNFYRPDVVFFVGIAGGIKDVKRGDVVVATKVYGYESGKEGPEGFEPRPILGISTYRMVQRASAEARNDSWLRRLRSTPPTASPNVYIGPLVAGEKVIASTHSMLWQFLRKTYSDALAVEMEGHGFLQAIHANEPVKALIIRGISDLLDDKQEAEGEGSQQIAAEHASAFAFELLAKLSDEVAVKESPPSQSARFGRPFPEIWNVSRRHNAFFTGRDHLLQQLFDGFAPESAIGMAISQAITGLGGMGKTQTAAEYAYRYREYYRAVLWVKAETQEDLVTHFQTIASSLKLPQERLQDRTSLIQTMHEWFITQTEWLLILDNADDLALVDPFLPKAARGHILLTTRAGAPNAQGQPLVLEPLSPEAGALCILRRAGILTWQGQLSDALQADVDTAQKLSQLMDGLPLALEQAGAYMNDTACGVRRYLHLYEQYRKEVQYVHHGAAPDYPESVASAWKISRNIVEQSNPAASELLRLCAFLAPEAIPDELLTKGASALGPILEPVAANPVALDLAIGTLRKYSLLNREADREKDLTRLSIHRIMQEILQDEMDEPTQQLWAERTIQAVACALPAVEWQIMQAHARNCLSLIEQWNIISPEAERICQRLAEAGDMKDK